MADVLDRGYHDAIRQTLGMTEDELSDAEIDNPFVLPYIEGAMVEALPSWESLNDYGLAAFQRATMLRVAVTLLPRARLRLTQMESDNKSITQRWGYMQWSELEGMLWGQYAEAVNSIPAMALPTKDLIVSAAPPRDEITGE